MDAAGFAALFEQHRLDIFRYLRSRGLSEEDAADLTADTFERALRARHQYRPSRGAPMPWLLRIARNAATDLLRRRQAAQRGFRVWPLRTSEPDPAVTLLRDEAARRLAQHVADLSEPQRDAVRLRYAAGLTAREIGDVLGRTEAAAQKLLTRALTALKEAYRDDA